MMLISYAHKDAPNGARYIQDDLEAVPEWAVEIRSEESEAPPQAPGQGMYESFMAHNERLNNCGMDSWNDLSEEDQNVWNAMAEQYVAA